MQMKDQFGIGNDSAARPDQKAELIFSAIISEHLVTGEPVGSKAVSERFANATGMSSATVRNVMSDLEELGLLEQPHTSAGRVPTDVGYRYYVDNLLGVLKLSDEDLGQIQKELGINDFEIPDTPEKLMERTSHVLSALSQNVGIVVSPSLDLSADGATMVAMVKSRSVIALFEPSGSLTWLMWIEAPTSRPVTSIAISSGILSAWQISSSS